MSTERRLATRLSIENLPDELKYITFKKRGLMSKQYKATLIDASNYGMSFIAKNMKPDDIKNGQVIILYIFASGSKLKSKIIYTENLPGEEIKVGVTFTKPHILEKYHNILQDISCK